MNYKVGDKVRIKSLDWYNENKGNADKTNSVWCEDGGAWFFYHMSQYCGKIMTIKNVWSLSYTLEGSDSRWTDEMIECKVEEEEIEFTEVDKYWCDIMSESDPTTYVLPEGYIFKDENGNVINATKIVLEKKKKEYPKTYEECCKVMNYCCNPISVKTIHKEELIRKFQFLILYRDAYWKIAGEELGLGKPWKPDWNCNEYKYGIQVYENKVEYVMATHTQIAFPMPTEEMRDAFYENFKELIEICKELL